MKKIVAVIAALSLLLTMMPAMSFAGTADTGDKGDKLSHIVAGAENAEAHVVMQGQKDVYFNDLDYAIDYANKISTFSRARVKPTATVVVDKTALIDSKHDGSTGSMSAITGNVVIDVNGKAVEVINEKLVEIYKGTETPLTEGCLDVTGGKLTIKDTPKSGLFYNYNGTEIKKSGSMVIDDSCYFMECETIELSGAAKLDVNGYVAGAYFIADIANLKPLIQAGGYSSVNISGLIENGSRSTLYLNDKAKGYVDGYLYFTANRSSDLFAVVSDGNSEFTLEENGIIEDYFGGAYSAKGSSKGALSGLVYSVYGIMDTSGKASVSVDEGGRIISYYGEAFRLGGNSVLTVKPGALVESLARSTVCFASYSNATLNNWGQIAGLSLSDIMVRVAVETPSAEVENPLMTTGAASLSSDQMMAEAVVKIQKFNAAMNQEAVRTGVEAVSLVDTLMIYNKVTDLHIETGGPACLKNTGDSIKELMASKMDEALKYTVVENTAPEQTSASIWYRCKPVIDATGVDEGCCTINIGSANPWMILNKSGIITLDKEGKASFASSPQGYVYSDSGVGIASFGKNSTVNVYEGLVVAKAGIVANNGTLNINSSDKNKEIVILGKGDKMTDADFSVNNMDGAFYETGDAIILDYKSIGGQASNLKASITGNSSNLYVGLNLKTPAADAKAVNVVVDNNEASHKIISAGTYQTDVNSYAAEGYSSVEKSDSKYNKVFGEKLYSVEAQKKTSDKTGISAKKNKWRAGFGIKILLSVSVPRLSKIFI